MYNNMMNTGKMNANGYEKYREQHVTHASPQELVLMVYDCCIKNLKLGRISIEEGKIEKCNKELQKAQDCLNELIMGLDFNYPISNQLFGLYDFMLNEIIQANLSKEKDKIAPVLEMLQELREAWADAVRQNRSASFAGGEM